MKTIITFLCIATSISMVAQEYEKSDSLNFQTETEDITINGEGLTEAYTLNPDSTKGDTTRIELKNASITIISKNKTSKSCWDDDDEDSIESKKYQLTWWNGIDIGVNGILSGNHDFNLPASTEFLEPNYGKSRYISFNMGQVKGRIVNDYVGFTMGLTFQIYNYKYSGENEFAFVGDSLFSFPSGDKNITKNKLRASYIGIPAMLEFNTSLDPRKSFHISAGVIGKIKIEDMYKQKYNLDGNDNKASIKGDLGFNRWGADALVRVGYGRFTLFTQVGLLPLFDNANTNDVYSFAAGLFIKV